MNTLPVRCGFRRTMTSIAIHRLFLLILTVTAFTVSALAQNIQKLDPALGQLVGPDSKLERIATGFNKWIEGPVWTHKGTLLFAEIPANNIDIWIPGNGASACMHPSGSTVARRIKGPAAAERHRFFAGREVLVHRGFRQEDLDALSGAA